MWYISKVTKNREIERERKMHVRWVLEIKKFKKLELSTYIDKGPR